MCAWGAVFASLDPDDDVLTVGLNRAVDVLAKKLASVRSLGPHPKDGVAVIVRKGRFGPYAQHGQTVANLPREATLETITLDEAVALLAAKGKQLKPKGRKGAQPRGGKAASPRSGKKAQPPADAAPKAAAKAKQAAKPQPKAKAKPQPKAKAKPKPKAKAKPEPKAKPARRRAAG